MMDTSMDDLEMNVKLLDIGKEIGSGAFGRVVKATVKANANLPPGLHKNMTVAVKMLKGRIYIYIIRGVSTMQVSLSLKKT